MALEKTQCAFAGPETVEKTQLKFAVSEATGKLIGFVSRHSKTRQLRGVREDSHYKKKICVLSEELAGQIRPNILYSVELKAMHNSHGFVVVAASPVLFRPSIETVLTPAGTYRIVISFGNKTVYFDPVHGKSYTSKTLSGVIALLRKRTDIEDLDRVIERFKAEAEKLKHLMIDAGVYQQEIPGL